MKFNEKLINLRKQKGLSQEELGYKLNVTRQTVSKWELGETTPDMSKLGEISKFFEVSVDYLLSETEEGKTEEVKMEDKKINDDEQKNKKTVLIIIGITAILIIVGAIVINSVIKSFCGAFGLAKEGEKGFLQIAKDMISIAEKEISKENESSQTIKDVETRKNKQTEEQYNSFANEIEEKYSNYVKDSERKYTTSVLEMYNGTNKGMTVKSVIDKIITNNKKNSDEQIVVTYNEKSITDTTELQKLKANFDQMTDYEISYDYDENKNINKMNILDLN